jgi:hypothetical protein
VLTLSILTDWVLFFLCRLNLNDFALSGIDSIDIPTTIRTQVPSFPDFKLRGFWGGFASKRHHL